MVASTKLLHLLEVCDVLCSISAFRCYYSFVVVFCSFSFCSAAITFDSFSLLYVLEKPNFDA